MIKYSIRGLNGGKMSIFFLFFFLKNKTERYLLSQIFLVMEVQKYGRGIQKIVGNYFKIPI